MKNEVKIAFQRELERGKTQYYARDFNTSFYHMEKAHILGQRFLWAHIVVHVWMLKIGLQRQDVKEVFGQFLRILAALLGYVLGWLPVGNTGGTNVSAIKPMLIPEDFHSYFVHYSLKRGIIIRVFILFLMSMISLYYLNTKHPPIQVTNVEQNQHNRITNFGRTTSLSILPLVNWHSTFPNLQTEAGVSYLIKTDQHTLLFDIGWNEHNQTPSPLIHNMQALGIAIEDIDTLFISHAHHDHVGGNRWERQGSFSLYTTQPPLPMNHIFAPTPLQYPGSIIKNIDTAQPLLQAIASTGPISRQLVMGNMDEQSMVISVEGKGLVIFVGCGHQTLAKLIKHVQNRFSQPIYAIIGDLHYPVPNGRRFAFGIDLQKRFSSGTGFFSPLTQSDVNKDKALLDQLGLGLIALGSHDTSDQVLTDFAQHFGRTFQKVNVGEWIFIP